MTSSRLRLGLVFGGMSVEHEVSVVSAQHVIAAADPNRFEVVPIGVTPEGVWLTPIETAAALAKPEAPFHKRIERQPSLIPSVRFEDMEERANLAAAFDALASVDVVFPLIHGTHGEDGTLQGLLELARLPYVGCGVAASALGMDKALMKSVFKAEGLPVSDYVVLNVVEDGSDLLDHARDIEMRFTLPVFVKPASGGSSLGVSKVRSREELVTGLAEAAKYDRKIVVEPAIEGREVDCAVLGNRDAQASPLGEVRHRRDFYDYEAKYLDPQTQILAPADVPADVTKRGQDLALRAFHAIDGSGFSRVDFFLRPDGSLLIDEINTIPGFTPASMFPRLWQAVGVSYSELIARLVDFALARHRERPIA
ncbi:MAG TPA: D-alanine--D-alanine ligase family protein [Dehalococcoidia bacterium]|nr:D-alanine--D-alanine ligase family protein [Dehalococcoidia bacterium]